MTPSDILASGRTACRIDWVMNGLRWEDLFFNLPDGTTYSEALHQAERRLPLLKRGFREDDHDFGYQIVGCADAPEGLVEHPFAEA